MRILLTTMVISALVLSGCGGWRDSRVNPSNWFGKSRPAPTKQETPESINPLIPEQTGIFRRDKREVYEGALVAQVLDVVIEPLPTGGIVRVTGATRMQGAYDVRLVNNTDNEPVDGVLTFELRAVQPTDQGVGTANGRTVRVGEFVSLQKLGRTSTVRVVGGTNAHEARRR